MSISTNPDRLGQFVLEMPISQANAARDALEAIGIAFNPRRAIIGDVDTIDYTGDNLPDIIIPIREFHRHRGKQHSLRWSTAAISLSDMDAILTLGKNCCIWEKGQDGNAPRVVGVDHESWDEFVEQFPHLIEELAW